MTNEYKKAVDCIRKAMDCLQRYYDTNHEFLELDDCDNLLYLIADCKSIVDDTTKSFIIECLLAAVDYCKTQYTQSGIDWLPSATTLNLKNEADKFTLMIDFINELT